MAKFFILGEVASKNIDCKMFQKLLDFKTLCTYKLLLLSLLWNKFKQH